MGRSWKVNIMVHGLDPFGRLHGEEKTTPVLLVARYGTASAMEPLAMAAYRVGHLTTGYDLEMVIWFTIWFTIYLCFTNSITWLLSNEKTHVLDGYYLFMLYTFVPIALQRPCIQWSKCNLESHSEKWPPTTEICDVGFLLACTKRQKEEEGVHDLNPVINCHLLPAVSSQIFTDKTCWGPHEQQLHTVQPPQQDPQWQDEETWPRILIQTWQKNEENQQVQPIATL